MNSVKCLLIILLITVSWTLLGDGDLDASKTCAAEGGCPDDKIVKILTNQIENSDPPLKMNTSFHIFSAMEANGNLQEVAHSLEFACLSLADRPELLKEVRMTAATSQMLHHKLAELMEKISVTSASKVELITFIRDALLDPKNPKKEELVKDAFDMIKEQDEELKQKAEEIRDGYKEVYKVQQGINGDVVKKIHHFENEITSVEENMETIKERIRAAKLAKEEYGKEKQAIVNNLEMVQQDLKMLRERVGMAVGNMEAYGKNGFIEGLRWISLAGGYVAAIVGTISDWFNHFKLKEEFKVCMEAYMELQQVSERLLDRQMDVSSQIHEQHTLEDKYLAELRELEKQYANYGDVKRIQNALYHLKEVENEFRRIIQYCTTLITTLSSMSSNSKLGTLFLKKPDDPKYVEKFQTILKYQKQTLEVLSATGDFFVKSSGQDIDVLYNFLSADTYNMAASKRK